MISEAFSVLLQKISSMSTYEIIGIIAGAASVVGMMWGAVWAVCKVMFMFGEYKGKQDALREYSEENIKKLNTTFIAFSKKNLIA